MLPSIRKNAKGFTLVEVIVVAVIVAVLALVAIQLYQGYVKESRLNTSENLAASAASFIQSALNSSGKTDAGLGTSWTPTLPLAAGGAGWTVFLPSGQQVNFTCPTGFQIDVGGAGAGTIRAEYVADATIFSKDYRYQ